MDVREIVNKKLTLLLSLLFFIQRKAVVASQCVCGVGRKHEFV